MNRPVGGSVLLAVSVLIAPISAGSGRQISESVFIVVIDGIRGTEAFDDPALELLPNTREELLPSGTLFRDFYNVGTTATTSGHQSIVSGVRNARLNDGVVPIQVICHWPTLFEYYRQYQGVPGKRTLLALGKYGNVQYLDYSLHPLFGKAFGGRTRHNVCQAKDRETWHFLKREMQESRLSLVLVNLGEVDHAGHTAEWDLYVAAIRQADRIVAEMWQEIQSLAHYRDRTSLLITTDHGRHSPGVWSGFVGHGCACLGCRRCFLLAMGPRIRRGQVVQGAAGELTDICPTAAHLLGIRAPFAEGRILRELFEEEPEPGSRLEETGQERPPSSCSHSVITNPARGDAWRPAIAATGETVHLAWARRAPFGRSIQYTRSADSGQTWSDPVDIFPADQNCSYSNPRMALLHGGTLVAVTSKLVFGAQAAPWYAVVRRSVDGGATWLREEAVGPVRMSTDPPALSAGPDDLLAMAFQTAVVSDEGEPVDSALMLTMSLDGGGEWSDPALLTHNVPPSHYVRDTAVAVRGDLPLVAWCDHNSSALESVTEQWAVWLGPYSASRGPAVRLSSGQKEADQPTIGVARDGSVHVVWAEKEPYSRRPWRLAWRANEDLDPGLIASGWSATKLLTPGSSAAWRPRLRSGGAGLFLLWEDFRTDRPQILLAQYRPNRRKWGPPMAIAEGRRNLVQHPEMCIDKHRVYIAWQERRGGLWQIAFAAIEVQ